MLREMPFLCVYMCALIHIFIWLCMCERVCVWSYYVAQASLGLTILLSQPPKYWDCMHVAMSSHTEIIFDLFFQPVISVLKQFSKSYFNYLLEFQNFLWWIHILSIITKNTIYSPSSSHACLLFLSPSSLSLSLSLLHVHVTASTVYIFYPQSYQLSHKGKNLFILVITVSLGPATMQNTVDIK